ncbi:MAG TPA: HAD family phosphatase [Mycobacteriales bacterium]|jgi:putative hydrolase of the HAD superfamily|nr:HAD family phosphatase [Mycobacteriales bacterium]
MTDSPSPYGLRGLVVDYGGVLTNSLGDAMRGWAEEAGVDHDEFGALMREWLLEGAADNPAHALERGHLSDAEFSVALAARLRRADGTALPSDGLLRTMMAGLVPNSSPMVAVVLRARRQGVRTALLSNSWGLDYDRTGWDALFDAVVISGEVGLRKPEPEIYRLTAERLGLGPEECVFVDDLAPNVRGAAAVGMVGVHYVDHGRVVTELEELLALALS